MSIRPPSGTDDFRTETFLDRLRPNFVDDPLALAFDAGGSDYTLNPDFAVHMIGTPLKDAAVLVGIVGDDDPRLIFTQRTEHLTAHAGQVAFPGGKIDRHDGHAVAAALREAEEEIGLDPTLVTPIGCLPPYASGSGFRIVPVIARVGEGAVFTPNPHEVADVFEVPLAFLMNEANHAIVARDWNGLTVRAYEMPYGERHIWGVTAGIVRRIWERTYGSVDVAAGA